MYSLISSSVIYDAAQGRGMSASDVEESKVQVGGGGTADTYTIGIRVTHVEKVLRVCRVCFRFKNILDTVCAADTHGKTHSANQDVHVVF